MIPSLVLIRQLSNAPVQKKVKLISFTSKLIVYCALARSKSVFQLYKTVPAIERLLTEAELVVAGFPVDIGGNQFDQFRQLKNPDKSLRGVIVPQVSGIRIILVVFFSQQSSAVNKVTRRRALTLSTVSMNKNTIVSQRY